VRVMTLVEYLSSLSPWSLSYLWIDLLCLAADSVLNRLDLGDLLLAGALSLRDGERLLDDTMVVLLLSG
jgi:hypothetical protein